MFFSFILPAYKLKFLKQAVDSILNQTYSNFELVIVDDASPEDIESLVKSYSDPRIRYYRNMENIGGVSLVKQWNHCIDYANGEYLILAADDDIYDLRFLEHIFSLVEKYPNVDLLRARVEIINENNDLIGLDGMSNEFLSKYEYLYYWLNATIFTCIGNYVFRSSEIKKKRFIDFPCAFGSDVASTINMSASGVANTVDTLFKFRISSIHLSSDKTKLKEKLKATNQLFAWFKNLNYDKPINNPVDLFCYQNTQWVDFYTKYVYDCYNQVVKYLPVRYLYLINHFSLLSKKDRIVMVFRYLKDRLLKF